LEVRQIRYGASRDRLGNFVWLDYAAPHKQVVLDVTVTNSASTNSIVPVVGGPLTLHGSLAIGGEAEGACENYFGDKVTDKSAVGRECMSWQRIAGTK
jgi:hypothetical protein